MELFNNTNPKAKDHKGVVGSFSVDSIKWEPSNDTEAGIIVHRFEYEDFPNGSFLKVAHSQVAVFINNLDIGDSLENIDAGKSQVEIFRGPCEIKLQTGDSRFAPFRNFMHKLTDGESAFHSTVYFINTTYMNELNWGTQAPLVVQDPEEEVNIHVRAFGLFGAHIEQLECENSKENIMFFLKKVVGTRGDYTRKQFCDFMRAKILEYVPDLLAKNIIEKQIGILKLSAKLSEFSEIIKEKLIDNFLQFGVRLDNFSFQSINAPDEDLRMLNEMKIERKRKQFEAEGKAKQIDIESSALARKREREGYTYQQEAGFDVMEKAASNEGTSSTFLGAGMGLGMGLGVAGTVGSNMGKIVNSTIGSTDMNEPSKTQTNIKKDVKICPSCKKEVSSSAKFCLECGQKISTGKTCSHCGEELVDGAKFCFNCGQKVIVHLSCSNCGTKLTDGAKFCFNCGQKI